MAVHRGAEAGWFDQQRQPQPQTQQQPAETEGEQQNLEPGLEPSPGHREGDPGNPAGPEREGKKQIRQSQRTDTSWRGPCLQRQPEQTLNGLLEAKQHGHHRQWQELRPLPAAGLLDRDGTQRQQYRRRGETGRTRETDWLRLEAAEAKP